MIKAIAEAQVKLATERLAIFNGKIQELESKKSKHSLISDERIRIKFEIIVTEKECEYWRGAKNTAEIILDQILEEEKALSEAK